MFPNDLQRARSYENSFLKVSINFRRSYVYKWNNNFTKEGYELPDIQFWAHISKHMPLPNWLPI